MAKIFASIVKRPLAALLAVAGITILAGISLFSSFRMETNLDEYMPKTHPAFIYSEEANERFLIKDSILIAVEHPDSIYNPETLGKLIEIEEALHSVEELADSRLQSIHSADNIVGSEEGLDIQRFYVSAPTSQDRKSVV